MQARGDGDGSPVCSSSQGRLCSQPAWMPSLWFACSIGVLKHRWPKRARHLSLNALHLPNRSQSLVSGFPGFCAAPLIADRTFQLVPQGFPRATEKTVLVLQQTHLSRCVMRCYSSSTGLAGRISGSDTRASSHSAQQSASPGQTPLTTRTDHRLRAARAPALCLRANMGCEAVECRAVACHSSPPRFLQAHQLHGSAGFGADLFPFLVC